MRRWVLSIALILLFCQFAEAQAPFDPAPGMFGYQFVRLPYMVRFNPMGSGVPVPPSGSFLPPPLSAAWRTQPGYWSQQQLAAPTASPALVPVTDYNAPELSWPNALAPQPEMMPPEPFPQGVPSQTESAPEGRVAPAPEGTGSTEPNSAANGATTAPTTAPAVMNVAVPRGAVRTALRVGDLSSLSRSPELSNRLTRIARDRGILAGPAIDVYFSGDVAILQGVVRTAHDRDLLANVAGLEPGVRQIYNGLVPEGATNHTASRAAR